jgi:hypothetical protein
MGSPIFVLSSGRSGSTLLQRVLNTYPDITIWGEHAGFLKETGDAFFRLLNDDGSRKFLFPKSGRTPEGVARNKRPGNWQAWMNCFSSEDVADFFRSHLESFFKPSFMGENHLWGFKEIRYGLGDRVIEFLSALYPDAIFVFLTRNGFDTLSSQMRSFSGMSRWQAFFPIRSIRVVCRNWRAQNQHFLDWHRSGKIRSFWFRYEDLLEDIKILEPLLTAVGKVIGPEQERVLHIKEGRGSAFRDDQALSRWKKLGFTQLCWAEMSLGRKNEALGYKSPPVVGLVRLFRRTCTKLIRLFSPRTNNGHPSEGGRGDLTAQGPYKAPGLGEKKEVSSC